MLVVWMVRGRILDAVSAGGVVVHLGVMPYAKLRKLRRYTESKQSKQTKSVLSVEKSFKINVLLVLISVIGFTSVI